MRLLEPPRTTNILTVVVVTAVVGGVAAAINQSVTMTVGIVSILVFATGGRLLAQREFSYQWVLGQVLAIGASCGLVLTLAAAVGFASIAYTGIGIVLSTTGTLAVIGGFGLIMWDVTPGTSSAAFHRIRHSILISWLVFITITVGLFAIQNQFGLETIGLEPQQLVTNSITQLTATASLGSVTVIVCTVLALYALRYLLTHPAITELYSQIKYGIVSHPAHTAATLLSEQAHAKNDGQQREPTSETAQSDTENANTDQADEASERKSESTWAEQWRPNSGHAIPFIHYTPSLMTTISRGVLVITLPVLSFAGLSIARDPPASMSAFDPVTHLNGSVTETVELLGGSAPIIVGMLLVTVVLVLLNISVRLIWRFVDRGWRRYVSRLRWLLAPGLVVVGVYVLASPLLDVLRERTSLHYILVSRSEPILVVQDSGLAINISNMSATTLQLEYNTELFLESLAAVTDLISAPGLLLASLAVVTLFGHMILVVGHLGVWRIAAYRAHATVVGPLLLLVGSVIVAGIGAPPMTALLITGCAFLLIHLRSLTVQHVRQFPRGAVTRRGELAYAAAPTVLIGVGIIIATVGFIDPFYQQLADLPEWRLLVGAVLTFAIVCLALLALSLSEE